MFYNLVVIILPTGERYNLIIKSVRRPLHTPRQVYHNLTHRNMKSAHKGAYSMVCILTALYSFFEVVVRLGIEHQYVLPFRG